MKKPHAGFSNVYNFVDYFVLFFPLSNLIFYNQFVFILYINEYEHNIYMYNKYLIYSLINVCFEFSITFNDKRLLHCIVRLIEQTEQGNVLFFQDFVGCFFLFIIVFCSTDCSRNNLKFIMCYKKLYISPYFITTFESKTRTTAKKKLKMVTCLSELSNIF